MVVSSTVLANATQFQVGSSSMTLLTLVFPGLFSLYLEAGCKMATNTEKGIDSDDCVQVPTLKEFVIFQSLRGVHVAAGIFLNKYHLMAISCSG